jgi:hypothetical protein
VVRVGVFFAMIILGRVVMLLGVPTLPAPSATGTCGAP